MNPTYELLENPGGQLKCKAVTCIKAQGFQTKTEKAQSIRSILVESMIEFKSLDINCRLSNKSYSLVRMRT